MLRPVEVVLSAASDFLQPSSVLRGRLQSQSGLQRRTRFGSESLVPPLVKNPPSIQDTVCNAGYLGLVPRLGRSPGVGNGNVLQYSCLENSMDRGALAG